MRTQLNDTAFDRGYEAYGKYATNPFAPGTVQHEQWEQGFLDAMDDEAYDIEDGYPGIDVTWDDEAMNFITYH